jgi:TRAP-type mannitol/chloroaromatic compound transport system permease small subunit
MKIISNQATENHYKIISHLLDRAAAIIFCVAFLLIAVKKKLHHNTSPTTNTLPPTKTKSFAKAFLLAASYAAITLL